MTGTQLRDALVKHPTVGALAEEARTAHLEALAADIDQTTTAAECTEVITYLESKIGSIMGQLETGRVTAEHRGASDAYLDWHTRAHHALSVAQMQHGRAKRHRHHFYELGKIDREAEHAARLAAKEAFTAEQRARNAETQLEINRMAAKRRLHERVCELIKERLGHQVHKDLFAAARMQGGV